jgi:NAD(P)-dependent dehydrogenase (short-subunit alcohol dehydrogenase family)
VGASSGIGKHLRERLLDQGTEVFGAGKNGPDVKIDLTASNQLDCWHVVNHAREQLGGDIDTLILNSGLLDIEYTEKLKPRKFEDLLRVNLITPLYFVQTFVQETVNLARNFVRPRKIICTTSMAAVIPMARSAPYCASKAGLEMAIQCWAKELRTSGYCVMGLAPGTVQGTGMFTQLVDGLTPESDYPEADASKMNQLRRPLSLDEVWMSYDMLINRCGMEHNGQIWRIH